MNINDKYLPLYQILSCWSVINSETFEDDHTEEEQAYWIKLSKVDTVMVSGGRDSSKTFSTSTWTCIAARDYHHRIMYTRYTMSSTDHSISKSLENRMELLGIQDSFETTNNHYVSKEGSGEIVITGQKTSSNKQTAKMKGIEDFTVFITDEGEELPEFEDWDKARKSIRGQDVQCLSIIIFNPPTREHFIYTEFWEDMDVEEGFCGIKDNVLYIHTTYLDNYEHLADHNKREYDKLKAYYDEYEALNNIERENAHPKLRKNWKKYKNVVKGGFLEIAEGVIYEDWEKGEFDNSLPFCRGMDFGFDDPDVMVKVAVDEQKKLIYVHQELNKNGLGTNQLGEIIIEKVGHDGLIVGDAAQKRLINDLYNLGINIVKCKKGHGSVNRTIKAVQGYTLVVTPESRDVHKALNNYVWHDKRSGVPKNEYKHFPDAIGYAAVEMMYL
jgi:phage terminase large subunit